MAVAAKAGNDPSTTQRIGTRGRGSTARPYTGEDEYLQIMVRQMQEKLAKTKPTGSAPAAQQQAPKTGLAPAAGAASDSPRKAWKPTPPQLKHGQPGHHKQGGPAPPENGVKKPQNSKQRKTGQPKPSNVQAGSRSKPPTFQAGDFPPLVSPQQKVNLAVQAAIQDLKQSLVPILTASILQTIQNWLTPQLEEIKASTKMPEQRRRKIVHRNPANSESEGTMEQPIAHQIETSMPTQAPTQAPVVMMPPPQQ
ncbi:uncharacterized protein LOC119456677 [Dermacentor silvarum]|uniref:uncharacterized protein LOC119456677 n=1 Tax=Dermacentor silvarum TaxID=543639 RepID=UPI001898998A|nr:uncharacterized protein LOC119456677 [Dermacentor silvarum]